LGGVGPGEVEAAVRDDGARGDVWGRLERRGRGAHAAREEDAPEAGEE
jgi:hypothetical protein